MTFEFDLSLYRIDRDVYSILDWIGDIGGLSEGLVIFFSGLIALMSFNNFDHHMIEYLYQRREFKESEEATPFANKKTRLCRQKCNETNCCNNFSFCKKLCRLSREERLFKKARDRMYEELDIVAFLKKIRRFEAFQKEMEL